MLKDFFRFSFSVSSFVSVVEETEGVDGDDIGLVRGLGSGVFYNSLKRGFLGFLGGSTSLGMVEM